MMDSVTARSIALVCASMRVVHERMWAAHLTPREQEIAWCLLRGMSHAEIARSLSVEVQTVKNYQWSIATRLSVTETPGGSCRLRILSTLLGVEG